MTPIEPSLADLERAKEAFEANEPRDLFYRAATELVGLTFREETSLSLAEALAVLLQTWNSSYYRFNKFDSQHFAEIEHVLESTSNVIASFRSKSIQEIAIEDREKVTDLFESFETVLGPVGAAKCLHLLAPHVFPIWDRQIAKSYEFELGKKGTNALRYWGFLLTTLNQCESLGGEEVVGRNPLKAIDEYNYCHFTKRWI